MVCHLGHFMDVRKLSSWIKKNYSVLFCGYLFLKLKLPFCIYLATWSKICSYRSHLARWPIHGGLGHADITLLSDIYWKTRLSWSGSSAAKLPGLSGWLWINGKFRFCDFGRCLGDGYIPGALMPPVQTGSISCWEQLWGCNGLVWVLCCCYCSGCILDWYCH